jgi:ribose-phosphate pyrophosphokinase
VIIVQSHARSDFGSPNDAWAEQMLMASAAHLAGARSITAVSPWLGYTRQDRKDKGRDPIGVQAVLRTLDHCGVGHFMTVDMHAPASQGNVFRPLDNLSMQPELRQEIVNGLTRADFPEDSWLIVAPDEGALKMAKRHARLMGGGVETVFIPKERSKADSTQLIRDSLGFDPAGRVCVMFDDIVDTAGTLVSAAEELRNAGALAVHVAATHNSLSHPAIERLTQTDAIDRLVTSNTHPVGDAANQLGDMYTVLDCAPLVGRSLLANLLGESVSELMDGENYF